MPIYDSTGLAWSENPESIIIGEGETKTFSFKYYSRYINKIDITSDDPTNNIIKSTTYETKIIGDEYWASVTVVGGQHGGGEVNLTVTTYATMSSTSEKITTIKVVEAIIAKQIKFFDTNNEPLANNKLIAPKYICKITQGEDDPNKGSKPSTSNKCLKITNNKEYVKFTYSKIGSSIDQSEYSWVTLSDIFYLSQGKFGSICLKGKIDDTSRNITRDMLQVNGDDARGYTYWYIPITLQSV